ncbi:MAG: hypothetical protein K8H89_12930 [Flavobacteriales bacterium]|jgi:hypothetical protein|nr:hypothetical protein [Flavobacteriales bacterium]MCB0757641.1 hypothetical protein [Flavobacteriales bacterium]
MRQAFPFLVLLFGTFAANGQSPKEKFIKYGLQVDRAKTAAAHGRHQQAMAIYDSAFALVPFMAYDYFDAVLNALAAGRDDKANDLLIQATENGFKVESRYDPALQEFLLSERSMPYLNMRDYMKERWLAHADTTMIRKLTKVGSWTILLEDDNGALSYSTDPAAFERLLSLARERGWPTPLNVGSAFYMTQNLLLEQLDNYPDNPRWQQVLPYIRSAMDRGALPPDYLAPFQDMENIKQGKPMAYGILLSYYREDPSKWYVVDHASLEKNRRSVGLGSIEDFLFRYDLDPSLMRYAEP